MKGCDFLSKKRNYRRLLFVFLIADIIAAGTMGYKEVKDSIPDTLYVRSGNEDGISKMLDNPLVTYPETLNVADSGTYRIPCSLLGVIPLKDVKVETVEEKWVSVCGMPIGLYMDTQGVLIVDTGEIIGSDGIPCEPAANIAKSGDYILQVDGEAVNSKKDLISRIHDCGGKPVTLLVKRGEEEVPISIDPVMGEDQEYKLGIWVRDNTQGIGTLTYVEEDGSYGALGHGISDTDTGELLDIAGGELYQAQIVSVLKGTKGNPGELSGYIDYDDSKRIGTIDSNTEKGIFGSVGDGCMYKLPLTSMEVGYKQEVETGEAQILAELEGEVKAYQVNITDIYRDQADTNKAFAIQVTDPELLAATGGIVQGMSGSPIVQNGKLIGAVTHVFVQDSTKGYGIFIEKMLED